VLLYLYIYVTKNFNDIQKWHYQPVTKSPKAENARGTNSNYLFSQNLISRSPLYCNSCTMLLCLVW